MQGKQYKAKVVVVGGGLGGLAAAADLALRGFEVELFEKNECLGGKLNILKKDGFSFDLGPSIFTLPQMFRPLFESDGRKLEDYIDLVRVDPQWRNFFEDGTTIDLFENLEDMKGELSRWPSHVFDEYARFLEYSKQQYHILDRGYFEAGLDSFWDFMRFYGLRGVSGLDLSSSMSKAISKRVSNPYLKNIFEYFIKYVGASALDAPAFMNLMPNIQVEYGLWYVRGGLYKLAEAFTRRLSELNVKVHLNSEVTKIDTDGNRVSAIEVRKGKETLRVKADFVVSNREVIPAYRDLLSESESFVSKLERKFEPACSGIVLHLGTNRLYPQLAHHNFFYSQNQEKHFKTVFQKKLLPDDPTIYVVAPTRTDPTQAPAGHDNIKILPHIPYIREDRPLQMSDYIALKDRVLDKLERMGLENLRQHIVVEDFWTPLDIEKRYASNRGSIYGVVSDWRRNFAFKAPKASRKYKNLYFVGGSVNPGGGMPMVVLSGRHASRMIDEKHASHG